MKKFENIVLLNSNSTVFDSYFEWKVIFFVIIHVLLFLNLSLALDIIGILSFLIEIFRSWINFDFNHSLRRSEFKCIGQEI